MAREYTNIADAISAVNTEVSAQTTQIADILTALQGKSGGGGLPSVISKIDGGSFTVASDTALSAHPIDHSLGAIPKGGILWTEDDSVAPTISTNMILSVLWNDSTTYEGSTEKFGYCVLRFKRANLSTGVSQYSQSALNSILTATQLKLQRTEVLKANTTYKWLAWA